MMFTPDQGLGDRAAQMTVGAARTIAKQARKVHTDPALRNARGKPTGFNGAIYSVLNATVTTAITAAIPANGPTVGPTWGKGQAQIFFYQDGQNSITAALDQTGDDGAGNSNVLNPYPVSVPVGKVIKINLGPGGYELLTYVC